MSITIGITTSKKTAWVIATIATRYPDTAYCVDGRGNAMRVPVCPIFVRPVTMAHCGEETIYIFGKKTEGGKKIALNDAMCYSATNILFPPKHNKTWSGYLAELKEGKC